MHHYAHICTCQCIFQKPFWIPVNDQFGLRGIERWTAWFVVQYPTSRLSPLVNNTFGYLIWTRWGFNFIQCKRLLMLRECLSVTDCRVQRHFVFVLLSVIGYHRVTMAININVFSFYLTGGIHICRNIFIESKWHIHVYEYMYKTYINIIKLHSLKSREVKLDWVLPTIKIEKGILNWFFMFNL